MPIRLGKRRITSLSRVAHPVNSSLKRLLYGCQFRRLGAPVGSPSRGWRFKETTWSTQLKSIWAAESSLLKRAGWPNRRMAPWSSVPAIPPCSSPPACQMIRNGSGLLSAHRRLPGVYIRRRPFSGRIYQARGTSHGKGSLTSRLIDRPIRPLFPRVSCMKPQVIAMVLSADPEQDPNSLAVAGAAAALAISDLPFHYVWEACGGVEEWRLHRQSHLPPRAANPL